MTPATRALCDRLIYDIACLEHTVECLSDEELAEVVPGAGAPVAGILAHLAELHEVANRLLDGEDGAALPAPAACSSMPAASAADIGELLGAIADARDDTLDLLADSDPDGDPSADIDAWSRHYYDHGLQLVAAFAQLHIDPLLLAWTLRTKPVDDAAAGLQQRIRLSAAEQLNALEEEPQEA